MTSIHTICEFACKSYTIKQKWITIHIVEAMIAGGRNIASACRSVIYCPHFYQWKKVEQGESYSHLKRARDSLVSPATITPALNETSYGGFVLTSAAISPSHISMCWQKLVISPVLVQYPQVA